MTYAVQIARSILEMQDRLMDLEYENERLREFEAKYKELLNSSVQHGMENVAGLLALTAKLGQSGYFDKDTK
jgi:hypothetical protein